MLSAVVPLDAIRAVHGAGVEVLRLDGPAESDDPEADLLVPRGQADLAASALEGLDWRFVVGRHGLRRFACDASYGWDGGLVIHLRWGLPAAPLPSAVLSTLECLVWERARPGEGGLLSIDPATQFVLASVQIARPNARRARWRRILAEAAIRIEDWNEVATISERAGVTGSVRRASVTAGTAGTPSGGDQLRDRAWLVSRRVYRRTSSRRLRAALAGAPLLGQSRRRCRFAGIEVLVGPGVFRPMPVTEGMVEAALARIQPGEAASALEVGTGCGAVALALAAARPDGHVFAADVSSAALRWARRNQRALGTRVRFHRGSLLDGFPSSLEHRAETVLGNVPYIPPGQAQAGSRDTPGAVVGEGDDGLGLVRRLGVDARRFLRPGGCLILQLLGSQWEGLAGELRALGYRPDGVVRSRGPHVVVVATLP